MLTVHAAYGGNTADIIFYNGVVVTMDDQQPDAQAISYELDLDSRVLLDIFSLRGREITVLVDDKQSAGSHSVTWDSSWSDGRTVSSGGCICRLNVTGSEGASVETRKMVALE